MKKNYSCFSAFFLAMLLLLPGLASARSVKSIQVPTQQGLIELANFKGQVIYLDFWASWCTPCKKSFPWLNQMQSKYQANGLKIIAVNLDEDQELARRFLAKHPAKFEIGYDPDGSIASRLQVQGMPSSFLINRDGEIVSSHVGFLEKDTVSMEQKIVDVLSQ
ncbi:MAG: TlpA disulfide reductase family protein [Thioalkalispiraceae bacterium]|jgi:thiol-disulfide isomerase/thioredoxin